MAQIIDIRPVSPKDLSSLSPPLDTNADKSLAQRLYESAIEKSGKTISWYTERKEVKKRGAKRLRTLAIVFGAAAAIIPIGTVVLFPEHGRLSALASVSAALSAAFIAADRVLGYSASWMRYTITILEVQAQLDDFIMSWAILQLDSKTPASDHPSRKDVDSLELIKAYISRLNSTVQGETREWTTEFKGALAVLEQKAQEHRSTTSAATVSLGAVRIVLNNHESLDDGTWTLQIGRLEPMHQSTRAVVLTDIFPGITRIRASGRCKGVLRSTEEIAIIRPGEASTITVLI